MPEYITLAADVLVIPAKTNDDAPTYQPVLRVMPPSNLGDDIIWSDPDGAIPSRETAMVLATQKGRGLLGTMVVRALKPVPTDG